MSETTRIVDGILELALRDSTDPDVALLARAVLHLYKQTGQIHSDNLQAFEQIEELERRQLHPR